MKERIVVLSVHEGQVGITLSTLFAYKKIPLQGTIVAIQAAPGADDAGLTLDVDNVTDSSAIATAIICATKDTPGVWLTPGFGGTNTPAAVDAGDIISFDLNASAADTGIQVDIWLLTGEQAA